jgi:uncharacterized LabA/DUF88 family protein
VPKEPRTKRVIAFIDGRNLRNAARKSFGARRFENINPLAIARKVCEARGWRLESVRFYAGVPLEDRVVLGETAEDWRVRTDRWRAQGVQVLTRSLARNNREKGIDVRLSLDLVRLFQGRAYDVALIFSQDQDFQEAVAEVKDLSGTGGRWVHTVSAYPGQPSRDHRGIENADEQIALSREEVEPCLDDEEVKFRPLRPWLSWRAFRGYVTGGASSFYLAAHAGTTCWMCWATLNTTQPSGPHEIPFIIAGHAAQAFFWPMLWVQGLFP